MSNYIRILVPQFFPLTSDSPDSDAPTLFLPRLSGLYTRRGKSACNVVRHDATSCDEVESQPNPPLTPEEK
jgi:hypothetical protein